jgi:hypothetical protein
MANELFVGGRVILLARDVEKMSKLCDETGYPTRSFVEHLREYIGAYGTVYAAHATGHVSVQFPVNPTTGYRGWSFSMHSDWLKD